MKKLGTLGLGALALLAAGCAATSARLDAPSADRASVGRPLAHMRALFAPPSPADRAGQAYGAFLAAQQAGRFSDRESATSFYRQALEAEPDDPYLLERAFTDALTNGDIEEATRLGERLIGSPSSDRLARVVLASRAVKDGRYKRAVELLEGRDLGPFNRVIGSLVLAWAYDGLGDPDSALAVLSAPADAPILGHLMTLHRALVLERAGRMTEADRAYKAALDSGVMRSMVVDAYGRRLERAGRSDDARALYAEQLAGAPSDAAARNGMDRVASGSRPELMAATPAQGASLGVLGPAWTLAQLSDPSDAAGPPLAIIYLRLALYIDPGNAEARFDLGRLLSRAGLGQDALDVLQKTPASSPYYVTSQVAAAQQLLDLDRKDEGFEKLRALVSETKAPLARTVLADALAMDGRNADALAIYDSLVAEQTADGKTADWGLYYARGITHQALGDWGAAEADFQAALAIAPNEARVLNYLGYTWVDRGERLDEAFDLIRRAVALDPSSGAYVDSLGWAHFKRGEYETAVQQLERAVELDPRDPTINEHLGDAYWRVGRRLEASYQWRRSLTLDPGDDMRASIENKLANGLPPVAR